MTLPARTTDLHATDVEIGLAEARSRLGELVNRVHEGNIVYLTRNGTPTAAILSVDELRRLVEAEEELADLRAVIAADRK
ncbi:MULTISPECIES: type II toxin-antitoxin system Phd/YefM family antitoxin [unclassified Frankia]|uniref:type II toxin-antitoxin system Phd/YefM family antitoxin n=1 Tax=unclassified Frankia TaxID=2632575 RepID=UPI002024EA50